MFHLDHSFFQVTCYEANPLIFEDEISMDCQVTTKSADFASLENLYVYDTMCMCVAYDKLTCQLSCH